MEFVFYDRSETYGRLTVVKDLCLDTLLLLLLFMDFRHRWLSYTRPIVFYYF